MATQTQSASPPEITILNRVYSIPLIGSSIDTINSTLASNSYTCAPYSTAKGLSVSAYKFSEPFQVRLAPLIVRADDFANKAVDVVENKYPYPFKAKPEEVANYVKESSGKYVKERRDSAYKTLDDNVKSPAFTYAQAIDQRFTPVVDYFELTVSKISPKATQSEPAESKYQYQRALALSKSLIYSQEQSALVRKATKTAQYITDSAAYSVQATRTVVSDLSNTMITDLSKLRNSLSSDLAELQTTLHDIIKDLRSTIQSDLPLNEKCVRVATDVKERVTPVLDAMRTRVTEIASHVLSIKVEDVKSDQRKVTHGNGTGNGRA